MAEQLATDEREVGVQVVAKAGAILDRLAEDGETTAGDLADRIGEPRSSVYRLLATLQRLELVETGSRRGTYRLGLKLIRLGAAVAERFDVRAAALPVMERIHEATGEAVFLCVRRELEAVCIERLEGRRVQSLALRLGGSLPLHAGAAPLVLLAFEPPALWETYLDGEPLESFTPSTPTRPSVVRARLQETRDRGYAVSDQDVTPGIAALGAPVFDHRGAICGALSISGVRPAILGREERRLSRLIVDGANEISRALGHSPTQEGSS